MQNSTHYRKSEKVELIMMQCRETSVAQIADLLRDANTDGSKACVLIGAGASYSAGIGLAGDFIRRIEENYKSIYAAVCEEMKDGSKPTYAQCMAKLSPAKQVKIVRQDIDAAKINWAHIGLARLEKAEFVDTILTTNFDPLASRACSLFHRFPAIYDLAGLNAHSFDKSYVKGSAIFHLHGQHSGFLLLNTDDKLKAQALKIKPVLDAVAKGKPLIIVGYSGENDPLIDEIAALAPFNHGLFWVRHDDKDPSPDVVKKLLSLETCSVVRNAPSDEFFNNLANELLLDAPSFLASPFHHMLSVLEGIRPYSDMILGGGEDLLEQARVQLQQAADIQSEARPNQTKIAELMATGKFQEVWENYSDLVAEIDSSEKNMVAWAAVMLGTALSDQAKATQGAAADVLLAQAGEKYAAALAIKPDMHEALNNWGASLADQAKSRQGAAADVLFAQAGEKYAAALVIKPDKHEALNNWGNALSAQAKTRQGDAADTLFAQAGEKYAAALVIKPDMHEVLNNWGAMLADQATTKQGDAADVLFAEAGEKYAAALVIKPDKHEVLNNWGAMLADQATTKQGEVADTLFAQAGEKYAAALAIKPDMHEVLNNWGNALLRQAEAKQGDAADVLFAQAGEKYAAALAIKPDKHEALNNWGNALSAQAKTRQGDAADALYADALKRLCEAEVIKQGCACYNLACVASLQGNVSEAVDRLKKSRSLGVDWPGCAHLQTDTDFDGVREHPDFQQALAQIGCV